MSSVPRGRQIKTDQAKLLEEEAADYTYKVIENTPEGLVLQKALEALDESAARGSVAVLENGQDIVGYANVYISDMEPTIGGDIEQINEGDVWVDTDNNVIRRYTGTEWVIKGAAYL